MGCPHILPGSSNVDPCASCSELTRRLRERLAAVEAEREHYRQGMEDLTATGARLHADRGRLATELAEARARCVELERRAVPAERELAAIAQRLGLLSTATHQTVCNALDNIEADRANSEMAARDALGVAMGRLRVDGTCDEHGHFSGGSCWACDRKGLETAVGLLRAVASSTPCFSYPKVKQCRTCEVCRARAYLAAHPVKPSGG